MGEDVEMSEFDILYFKDMTPNIELAEIQVSKINNQNSASSQEARRIYHSETTLAEHL